MLKFYLTTVIIWYIIIFASVKITKEPIYKNGWTELDTNKKFFKGVFGCLLISTVPIIRLLVVIGLYILAFNKREGDK